MRHCEKCGQPYGPLALESGGFHYCAEQLYIPEPQALAGRLRTGDKIRVEILDESGGGRDPLITVDTFDSTGFWDKTGERFTWGQVIEYL